MQVTVGVDVTGIGVPITVHHSQRRRRASMTAPKGGGVGSCPCFLVVGLATLFVLLGVALLKKRKVDTEPKREGK